LRRRDDLAVGPDRRLEIRARNAGVDGGRGWRRVEPALAPAAGKSERGDERTDRCNPGKA